MSFFSFSFSSTSSFSPIHFFPRGARSFFYRFDSESPTVPQLSLVRSLARARSATLRDAASAARPRSAAEQERGTLRRRNRRRPRHRRHRVFPGRRDRREHDAFSGSERRRGQGELDLKGEGMKPKFEIEQLPDPRECPFGKRSFFSSRPPLFYFLSPSLAALRRQEHRISNQEHKKREREKELGGSNGARKKNRNSHG